MQDRKGWMLPCEKCGEIIKYDGVSLPSHTCPHCGAARPHTLKGSPLLPFLFFFAGWLVFGLLNPLEWSEDSLLFASFGSFMLLLWFKVCLPIHLEMLKSSLPKSKEQTQGSGALGCLSAGFLSGGILSLIMFFATYEWPEEVHYDYTPTIELTGYPIFVDPSDLSGTSSDAGGKIVPTLEAGPSTFPVSAVYGEKTKIRFVNRMEFPVRVFSVDANGSSTHASYLEQDFGSSDMNSYVGQTWLVTNDTGKPLLYFVAEKGAEGEIGLAPILSESLGN